MLLQNFVKRILTWLGVVVLSYFFEHCFFLFNNFCFRGLVSADVNLEKRVVPMLILRKLELIHKSTAHSLPQFRLVVHHLRGHEIRAFFLQIM